MKLLTTLILIAFFAGHASAENNGVGGPNTGAPTVGTNPAPAVTGGKCELGSDHLYRRVTPAEGCPSPVIPLSVAQKDSTCPKGEDAAAIAKAHASYEKLFTGQGLKAANEFLNVPYPDAPGEAETRDGKTVYRPNHGLAQGARTAALVQQTINAVLSSPNGGSLKTWLQNKMDNDAGFMKKFAMACALHRSGRTDEGDSFGTNKRVLEGQNAASNFEKAAAKSGICFTPSELADFKKAMILDGKRTSESVDISNLSRLMRAGHVLDLVRMGKHQESEVAGLVPELSQTELKGLWSKADSMQKVTGSSSDPKFFDLSTDPEALAKAINDYQGN